MTEYEVVVDNRVFTIKFTTDNQAVDENGKIIPWNDPRTAKARSRTFKGIADAMADQWGILEVQE